MISYPLAKELKDTGFPQSELALAQRRAGYDYVSLPTLATLIEACGENFGALGREPDCWVACEYVSERSEWENAHKGETPEDAVARLWLSLNQRVAEESAALPLGTSSNRTR
jgi:hypothetical protein